MPVIPVKGIGGVCLKMETFSLRPQPRRVAGSVLGEQGGHRPLYPRHTLLPLDPACPPATPQPHVHIQKTSGQDLGGPSWAFPQEGWKDFGVLVSYDQGPVFMFRSCHT